MKTEIDVRYLGRVLPNHRRPPRHLPWRRLLPRYERNVRRITGK